MPLHDGIGEAITGVHMGHVHGRQWMHDTQRQYEVSLLYMLVCYKLLTPHGTTTTLSYVQVGACALHEKNTKDEKNYFVA